MIPDGDRLSLDEEIAQLTRPYRHRERLVGRGADGKQRTVVRMADWPSLLDQLRQAVSEPSVRDEAGRSVPHSCEPGNPAAMSALMRIEAGAAEWVSVRLRAELRETVEGNLAYLLGSAYGQLALTGAIVRAVHKWWVWARVESLWEDPPRTLRDPCPYCGERTLRVVVPVAQPDEHCGWCTECAMTWEGAAAVSSLGMMLKEARESRELSAEECWRQARAGELSRPAR